MDATKVKTIVQTKMHHVFCKLDMNVHRIEKIYNIRCLITYFYVSYYYCLSNERDSKTQMITVVNDCNYSIACFKVFKYLIGTYLSSTTDTT